MLISLIRLFRLLAERRRAYEELSALSDRELADIGLNRSDIDAVVSGRFVR